MQSTRTDPNREEQQHWQLRDAHTNKQAAFDKESLHFTHTTVHMLSVSPQKAHFLLIESLL